MNSENWAKIKSIVAEVLDIDPADRPDFIESACDGDDELLGEVRSLLAFECVGEDPLERPAASFANHFREEALPSFAGRVIGNYRIVSEIGAGGMGAVFLAERSDGTFDGRTAIKLIRRGINSKIVLERFLNERRILASLKHPNIARLHDAGTSSDGIPYFVMEYVDGKSITDHANERSLNLRERLQLFRKVCAAVSFAHQNLVIHRDLKPSNILVTPDGEPKLLDFGIAKLLNTGSGVAAATQQFALTPDYSSPEHLRGDVLTTASDVYSLGIILFELLTGSRPYDTDGLSYGEIVRRVSEAETPRPSTAARENQRALSGDLDNITLKSLRKEPNRRYSSVEQFSEDIRRYLEDLPVMATRDSWKYRAGKFVSRNRYRVTAAGLVAVSVVAGLAATLYQAKAAERERVRAEQRFNDLRRLANSFTVEINEEIGKSPIRARELLINRSIEYLDKLAREDVDDPELQGDLAGAYEKIGELQANLFYPGLGKTDAAVASHRKALQIRERLYETDPNNALYGIDVVRSRMHIGDIYLTNGQVGDARQEYERSLEILEDLLKRNVENPEATLLVARLRARNGQAILRSGSLADTLANYQISLDTFRRLSEQSPDDQNLRRGAGILSSYIGYVKLEMLDFDAAVDYYRAALDATEQLLAVDPQNLQYRGESVAAQLWMGIALDRHGEFNEAKKQLDEALSTQKVIFVSDPANFGEQNALADCYLERAKVLAANSKFDAAIDDYNEAARNYQAVFDNDPQNLATQRQVLHTRMRLAEALQKSGRGAQAMPILLSNIKEQQQLVDKDPNNHEWQQDVATSEVLIGQNYYAAGKPAQAAKYFEKAVKTLERMALASPENKRLQNDLLSARRALEVCRAKSR
jgi:tetratricopeptide (TPR) repeat protein